MNSIGINGACRENWDRMSPNEQGRFCASCEKTVIDFTGCSKEEIVETLNTSGQSVCGRFKPHQVDQVKTKAFFKPVAATISGLALLSPAIAQQNTDAEVDSLIQHIQLEEFVITEAVPETSCDCTPSPGFWLGAVSQLVRSEKFIHTETKASKETTAPEARIYPNPATDFTNAGVA